MPQIESIVSSSEMSRHRRPDRLVAGAAAALLVLGACGSRDNEPSHTAPSSAVTATPSTGSASGEAAPLCDPMSAKPVVVDGQKLYCQEVQAPGGTRVHRQFEDASGWFTTLKAGEAVLVRCLALGPADAAPSAATNRQRPGVAEWYDIAQPVDGYSASNAFLNVTDRNVPFNEQPTADSRVPLCEE